MRENKKLQWRGATECQNSNARQTSVDIGAPILPTFSSIFIGHECQFYHSV